MRYAICPDTTYPVSSFALASQGVRTLDIGVSQEIAVMRDEPDAKVSYADFGQPVKGGTNFAV